MTEINNNNNMMFGGFGECDLVCKDGKDDKIRGGGFSMSSLFGGNNQPNMSKIFNSSIVLPAGYLTNSNAIKMPSKHGDDEPEDDEVEDDEVEDDELEDDDPDKNRHTNKPSDFLSNDDMDGFLANIKYRPKNDNNKTKKNKHLKKSSIEQHDNAFGATRLKNIAGAKPATPATRRRRSSKKNNTKKTKTKT